MQLSTHNGTHLDAPWHYHPTMNGGERAWTIDEVPLEWCFGRGVKLDFRDKPDGYVCSAADVEAELERLRHTLQPFDIMLVNTSAGARYGHDDFASGGVAAWDAEATLYLTGRGVKVTGIDGWKWDAPFSYTAKRIKLRRVATIHCSGKATRPCASRAPIVTSRSSPTSKRCRRPDLWCPVFP